MESVIPAAPIPGHRILPPPCNQRIASILFFISEITAPRPFAAKVRISMFHGIGVNIIQRSEIVNFASNTAIRITIPNLAPARFILPIPSGGRGVMQPMQPFAKFRQPRFQQQVVMVRKNHPCPHFGHAVPGKTINEQRLEFTQPIGRVKDRSMFIACRGHMIEIGTGIKMRRSMPRQSALPAQAKYFLPLFPAHPAPLIHTQDIARTTLINKVYSLRYTPGILQRGLPLRPIGAQRRCSSPFVVPSERSGDGLFRNEG